MRRKHLFLLLLSLLMAIAVRAEERYALIAHLNDGSKVQFFLAEEQPQIRFYNSVMTIHAVSTELVFGRDQVKDLVVEKVEASKIDEVQAEESRISFDLRRAGVVHVCGLTDQDRLQVFGLDGKNMTADVTRQGDEATIDLSAKPRGFYLVSVNKRFTFKLMKP